MFWRMQLTYSFETPGVPTTQIGQKMDHTTEILMKTQGRVKFFMKKIGLFEKMEDPRCLSLANILIFHGKKRRVVPAT